MSNILDGQLTPKEFIEFLESTVPKCYRSCVSHKFSFIETMEMLHNEAFCNDKGQFPKNTDLTSVELSKYLHSLKLAISRIVDRLEILYGGLE